MADFSLDKRLSDWNLSPPTVPKAIQDNGICSFLPCPDKTKAGGAKQEETNKQIEFEIQKQQRIQELTREATAVKQQLDQVELRYTSELKRQSIADRYFDSLKVNAGASGEGRSWYDPRRIWSNVLDSDISSQSVQKSIEQARVTANNLLAKAQRGDEAGYKAAVQSISGREYKRDDASMLVQPAAARVDEYLQSQKNGSDVIGETGAAVGAAVALVGRRYLPMPVTSKLGTVVMTGTFGGLEKGIVKAKVGDGPGDGMQLADIRSGAITGVAIGLGVLAATGVNNAVVRRIH